MVNFLLILWIFQLSFIHGLHGCQDKCDNADPFHHIEDELIMAQAVIEIQINQQRF